MVVYFIAADEVTLSPIKIGRSTNLKKRIKNLQTGSSTKLMLLGWIVSNDDLRLEKSLHKNFSANHSNLEWFDLDHNNILPVLLNAGCNGFIAKNANAFEIVGYDNDAVPEYLGICNWTDLDIERCCPFCGCLGGMHYQDASCMYYCLHCGELTNFPELPTDD